MAIDYRYPAEAYIPAAVRYGYIELSEARAEYSRLRSIAVKRLERLSRTEGARYSAFKQYGEKGFAPLPRNATPRDVGRALADVHRFLEMRTSSISQIRESQRQALETLQARGYSFVTKENIQEFGEFMEEARRLKLVSDNRGGSQPIVEFYGTVKRLQLPPEEVKQHFVEYLSKRAQLKQLPTPEPGKAAQSVDDVRKKVGLVDLRVRERLERILKHKRK